jgi:hypothetical protein
VPTRRAVAARTHADPARLPLTCAGRAELGTVAAYRRASGNGCCQALAVRLPPGQGLTPCWRRGPMPHANHGLLPRKRAATHAIACVALPSIPLDPRLGPSWPRCQRLSPHHHSVAARLRTA